MRARTTVPHGEQLGEVGDGVLAGAGHAHEFALLLG